MSKHYLQGEGDEGTDKVLRPLISDDYTNALENGEKRSYTAYGYRWAVMAIFVLAGVANAMVLLSWAPITDKAQTYWDNINITAVNLLSVIFQICYVPGTLLALRFSERYRLRGVLIRGGILTCVGCIIRAIGALLRDSVGSTGSYALILIGTIFVGLAQPFYLNMPAKIAATWFGVNERDIATTLCSLANPLGSAIGSLIPAMFVSSEELHDIKPEVRNLMLVQMIIALVAFALSFFFLRSQPKTPPSSSAEQMQIIKSTKALNTMYDEFLKLFDNYEYCKVLFSFAIVLGSLNAIAALLNQLPGGYSNGQIGLTGAVLIMCGFLGAFGTGFLLDYSKAYQWVLKGSYTLVLLSWIFFMSNCRANNFALFIISAALLGGCTLPTSKFFLLFFFVLLISLCNVLTSVFVFVFSSFHHRNVSRMLLSCSRRCISRIVIHGCQRDCHFHDIHWTGLVDDGQRWSCATLPLRHLGNGLPLHRLATYLILQGQIFPHGTRLLRNIIVDMCSVVL